MNTQMNPEFFADPLSNLPSRATLLLVVLLSMLVVPAVAVAQGADLDEAAAVERAKALEEAADEDEEEEAWGGAKLQERKRARKNNVDDPDVALLKEVQKKRRALERAINKVTNDAEGFPKLETRAERLTAKLLRASDAYFDKHSPLVEKYEVAATSGTLAGRKKTRNQLIKVRKKFLADIAKFQKRADKLRVDVDKMAARVAADALEE